MFILFDKAGVSIGNCDQQPDVDDLASRGEFAVEYLDTITGRLFFDFDTNTVEDRPNAPDGYHIWNAIQKEWQTNDELQEQKQRDEDAIKQTQITSLLAKAAQRISEYQDLKDFADTEEEAEAGESGYNLWRQYRATLLKYQKGLIPEMPVQPE